MMAVDATHVERYEWVNEYNIDTKNTGELHTTVARVAIQTHVIYADTFHPGANPSLMSSNSSYLFISPFVLNLEKTNMYF